MERAEALNALRLSGGTPSREDVASAFQKLSRRYPAQLFPEKHAHLLNARDALLKPECGFLSALFDEKVDMSWLADKLEDTRTKKMRESGNGFLAQILVSPVIQRILANRIHTIRHNEALHGEDDDEDDDELDFLDPLFEAFRRLQRRLD
jgi:hypothetical protein